jgi:methionine transaminase
MTEPSQKLAKFKSKLPNLGTSIFTEMSLMANQYKAINLSQGFPEFDPPEFLKTQLKEAVSNGFNQYCPSTGWPELLNQVGVLIQRKYQQNMMTEQQVDGAKNVTITSGATEALWVAIQTIVRQGDEVIIFDPAYDSYEPAVDLAGGSCRHIALNAPNYSIDWKLVESSINHKTRALIINSPHNPTGTLLSQNDMQQLQALLITHNLYLISDEVYEHIIFDQKPHLSVLSYPEIFKRAFVVSSFGKTFHCTGWKIGYCTAPDELTKEFRKIHQYVTFCSFTPAQIGIAAMLKNEPQHVDQLAVFYQNKRDVLVSALENSRFIILPSYGTYFLLVDYSQISDLNDVEFCHWLTQKIGVAAIPLSPFYQADELDNYHKNNKVVRLCFAKNDETLIKAAEILCGL